MADGSSRTGTRYANAQILAYVEALHAPHDGPLTAAFSAPEREGMPAIHVGPSEGKLVHLLLRLAGAKRAVEIGTLAGYSALWIARALGEGGELFTIENDPRHRRIAQTTLDAACLAARVTCLEGDAMSLIDRLAEQAPFDAVFVDADKGNYDGYGRFAAARLRRGGLLIADNAYYFGRLLEENAEARAMRRFHEETARAFDSVCIPTPDGLVLGIKR
jgi:caffeoyl-CoA O-methyltransferase